MKKALCIGAIVALSLSLSLSFSAQAQVKNFIDQPYIQVDASADTMITPDEIYIHISISEQDTKDKISVDELENRMADALAKIGVDIEKDLKVQDISSNFKNYLLKKKDVMKSKEYLLKVSDAPTAGKAFLALENLGISNTSIDHVDLSNKTAVQLELLSKAAKNARDKAEAMTQPLGQQLGKAIHIIQNQMRPVTVRRPVYAFAGLQKNEVQQAQPVENLSFEKIHLEAELQVKFILE